MSAEKLDLFKANKHEYVQAKKPTLIEVAPAQYLSVEGEGGPDGELFQARIGALYGMAYTMKFQAKFAGRDYTVSKLETLYELGDPSELSGAPSPEDWSWRMLIRVPDFIMEGDLAAARQQLSEKGKEGDFDATRLEKISEGPCVQLLHVGPYEAMAKSIRLIQEYCEAESKEPHLWQHQIYLNDPRRMPSERLKTLLRQPVR